jgi:hypothetical protein
MISTQSINPMYLTGTAPVPGVQGVQSVQGVQGMPAQPNAFGINPAGNGVQSFAPQTSPTQAWATQASPTNAEETNAFVGAAFGEAKRLLALSPPQQPQQPQAQLLPQQQLQVQQPQTLVQPQATPTTVAPSASVAGLQVPTQPTAPATPPLQAGQSDGQGNILVQMPTGLAWVPEAQLLQMYQQAATAPEQQGKVQLPNGQWVSKATLDAVLAKLQARLTLKELLAQGTITPEQFEQAGGNQDLKEVLAAGQKSQADKILAKRKEAQEYAASTRESIMSSQNPYASLGGTGGGGADVGSIG